jgi:hypothetical protein
MQRMMHLFDRGEREMRGAFVQPAKPLPRTQDRVPVVQARDNVLILRDMSVAAAVGVGSVDDALLSDQEIRAKLETYREDLLKQVRFEFQIVIGTRPQNLDVYYGKLLNWLDGLQSAERKMYGLEDGLTAFCQQGISSVEAFRNSFGFEPNDLRGLPGAVHALADLLASGDEEGLKLAEVRGPAVIDDAVQKIIHWQNLLELRVQHLRDQIEQRHAPVRTVYFATSYHVRLASKATVRLKGPLNEDEIARATRELENRCGQITRILERMQLKAWRASHDELVREIQYFYHPSQVNLAWREIRAEKSVAMGLAQTRV